MLRWGEAATNASHTALSSLNAILLLSIVCERASSPVDAHRDIAVAVVMVHHELLRQIGERLGEYPSRVQIVHPFAHEIDMRAGEVEYEADARRGVRAREHSCRECPKVLARRRVEHTRDENELVLLRERRLEDVPVFERR